MMERIQKMKGARCEWVFGAFAGFVVLSLLTMLVVDVFNVAGLRDRLVGDQEVSFWWYHWFDSPVEAPIQWVTLGAVIGVYGANAWKMRIEGQTRRFRLWLLLGFGALLMLLEDFGDIRHEIRIRLLRRVGEESYGVLTTMVELGFFALLGSVLVFAFLRYRTSFWGLVTTRRYLVAGFVLYAIAVGSSWLGSAFRDETEFRDLYTLVGDRVTSTIFGLDDEALRLFTEVSQRMSEGGGTPLEFYFMDRVFEESIELLGAGALLTAGLAFWFESKDE